MLNEKITRLVGQIKQDIGFTKRKGLALILCLTIVASLLVGCGGQSDDEPVDQAPIETTEGSDEETPTDEDDNIIRIGITQPLTGEHGNGGFLETLGIRYGNQVYSSVEIDGETYEIELVEIDNKSDKDIARTTAQNLIDSDVNIVIGSYGSALSIAGGDLFAEAGIPVIAPSATNPQVTLENDYYFRMCFLDSFQGKIMADYVFAEDIKTAAIITQQDDEYSSGLGDYFEEEFISLIDEDAIVAKEQYIANETNFETILLTVKEANPDIIFAPTSIETATNIINQARELEITSTIVGGDTWESLSLIENTEGSSDDIVFSTFYYEEDSTTAEAQAFISGFKEYLKENDQPEFIPSVSSLGYDAYLVALQAIQDAGSTDPTAIRDALANVEVEGVTGTISFDDVGDAKRDTAYIMTIKDGAFEFIKEATLTE